MKFCPKQLQMVSIKIEHNLGLHFGGVNPYGQTVKDRFYEFPKIDLKRFFKGKIVKNLGNI